MKRFTAAPLQLFAAAFVLLGALSPLRAQVATVNDQSDKIAGLKAELEEAKQTRDQVIAKRWQDKELDVEAHENFNQDYDDLKSKLEQKMQTADQLHADIQNLLQDAEASQAQAESRRVQFLALASTLHDKARELSGSLDKSFPAQIPERIQALNQVLQSAETKREAPGEILADLMTFERSELALTRAIVLEKRGFTRANKMPGEGLMLRLGTITSAYRDGKSGQVGLLLKNAPNTAFAPFDWREDLPPQISESLARAMESLEKDPTQPVLLPVDVLLTQNAVKTYTHVSKKNFFERLMTAVKTGGIFMWPLLIIPFFVIGLFVLKLLQLLRGRASSGLCAEAVARIERGDMSGARELCAKKPASLVLRVLGAISDLKPDLSRDQAEKTVRELMLHEVPRLERHLTTLSVLAAAAPLLGLLGTVSGLIAMFQIITAHGVNDPKLLAGGIGEALIATETGLLIAIPTLLGHNYLANRVDELVAGSEYYAMKALNALWPRG